MRPIAFFDSGIGGLSVLLAARKLLPCEQFVYYGDNARAPYGALSAEEISAYTIECVLKLMDLDIKALVLACNTATSVAVEKLRSELDIPVISMEPAIKPAFAIRKQGRVAVMATPATLVQPRFLNLLKTFDAEGNALLLPCHGLVELIEKGEFDSPEIRTYIGELFHPYRNTAIDAIVLGCTHFVLIENMIRDVCAKLCPMAQIIHGNEGTVRHLARVLAQRGMLSEGCTGKVAFYSSGDPQWLKRLFDKIMVTADKMEAKMR
ncbi:MAG: glutamate racemase [Bacillota bacterium]